MFCSYCQSWDHLFYSKTVFTVAKTTAWLLRVELWEHKGTQKNAFYHKNAAEGLGVAIEDIHGSCHHINQCNALQYYQKQSFAHHANRCDRSPG